MTEQWYSEVKDYEFGVATGSMKAGKSQVTRGPQRPNRIHRTIYQGSRGGEGGQTRVTALYIRVHGGGGGGQTRVTALYIQVYKGEEGFYSTTDLIHHFVK